jgi:hypothetical protein
MYEWIPSAVEDGTWRRRPSVRTTDRFGQVWELKIESSGFVTYRTAGALLGLSVPTLYDWEGRRFRPYTRKGVKMLRVKDLMRLAHERRFTETEEG